MREGDRAHHAVVVLGARDLAEVDVEAAGAELGHVLARVGREDGDVRGALPDDDGDADEDIWGDEDVPVTDHANLLIPLNNYNVKKIVYKVYHITVRCVLHGLEVDGPVYQGMPIEGLKMKLKEIFGIAENDQLIAYCGEYLQDGKLIGDYFVEDGGCRLPSSRSSRGCSRDARRPGPRQGQLLIGKF